MTNKLTNIAEAIETTTEQCMEKKDKDATIFDQIGGFEPVDPAVVADFERAMTELVPEIVRAVEARRLRAAQSRECQLKC